MATPGRAYDALYDGTYTVSGARDHYRQQTVGGGFQVARAPNYPYMFSDLPHYPATSYRFKNTDKVPAFVDRAFHETIVSAVELTVKSRAEQINGPNRFKYFRRPMLAAPEAAIIIKQAPPLPVAPSPPVVEEPKSKTVGTQSDYRENEAQTMPWEPECVLPVNPTEKQKALSAKYHTFGPELLKLKDLKFGDGLPPGLQEVRRIEKMREKRAFESTLPPIDDLERLPLRQKMIEEWEEKEWQDRELEIQSVQDERLALLEEALLAREEEFDENTMRRVGTRKTTMLLDGSGRFASIQADRIKTMRRLIEARKYVEKPRKLHKMTVVEKCANFGSSLYAPVQREGRFVDTKRIETEGFQPATLQGVHELEGYIPLRQLEPKIAVPVKPQKLDYMQRKDAAVQRDLKAINDLLDTAKLTKGARGIGNCWPAPLKDVALETGRNAFKRTTIRPTERPDTPVLPATASPDSNREAAAVLIQRLLRGRAAQNSMYEGKTRRKALIEELRVEVMGQGSSSRPEDTASIVISDLDTLIGKVLSTLCSALVEPNAELRSQRLADIMAEVPLLQTSRAVTPLLTGGAASAEASGSGQLDDDDARQREQHRGLTPTSPEMAAYVRPLDPRAAAAAAAQRRDAEAAAEAAKRNPAAVGAEGHAVHPDASAAEEQAVLVQHVDPGPVPATKDKQGETSAETAHAPSPPPSDATGTAVENTEDDVAASDDPEQMSGVDAVEPTSAAIAEESHAVESASPAHAEDSHAAPHAEEIAHQPAVESVHTPTPPEGRPPSGGSRPGSSARRAAAAAAPEAEVPPASSLVEAEQATGEELPQALDDVTAVAEELPEPSDSGLVGVESDAKKHKEDATMPQDVVKEEGTSALAGAEHEALVTTMDQQEGSADGTVSASPAEALAAAADGEENGAAADPVPSSATEEPENGAAADPVPSSATEEPENAAVSSSAQQEHEVAVEASAQIEASLAPNMGDLHLEPSLGEGVLSAEELPSTEAHQAGEEEVDLSAGVAPSLHEEATEPAGSHQEEAEE